MLGIHGAETVEQNILGVGLRDGEKRELGEWRDRPKSVATTGSLRSKAETINTRRSSSRQSRNVPTSFSNGVGVRMALTWRTGSLPRGNFYRTTLMANPRNLTSLLSLREIRNSPRFLA